MRPKDLRVRGRWTIRLETQNRFGSACRGSSHGIGASCYVSCGARSSSWYRKGVNLSVLKLRKLDALYGRLLARSARSKDWPTLPRVVDRPWARFVERSASTLCPRTSAGTATEGLRARRRRKAMTWSRRGDEGVSAGSAERTRGARAAVCSTVRSYCCLLVR